ncbi:MAG: hypothetical protein M5U34_22310 [Chloroflexi bacterium]|nr:hypothetical protein [Chloroflexota bacterium]
MMQPVEETAVLSPPPSAPIFTTRSLPPFRQEKEKRSAAAPQRMRQTAQPQREIPHQIDGPHTQISQPFSQPMENGRYAHCVSSICQSWGHAILINLGKRPKTAAA